MQLNCSRYNAGYNSRNDTRNEKSWTLKDLGRASVMFLCWTRMDWPYLEIANKRQERVSEALARKSIRQFSPDLSSCHKNILYGWNVQPIFCSFSGKSRYSKPRSTRHHDNKTKRWWATTLSFLFALFFMLEEVWQAAKVQGFQHAHQEDACAGIR
jgi:hypothetical protein